MIELKDKGISKLLSVSIIVVIIIVAAFAYTAFYFFAPTGKKEINIMSGWTFDPITVAMTEHIIPEYEESHPDVEITYELVKYADHYSRYASMKATGTVPDIIISMDTVAAPLWEEGDILPINDIIDGIEEGFFYEDVLELGHFDEEGYYIIPEHLSASQIIYRKDLFVEYGIEVPETWDELREAAEKLTLDTDEDGDIDIYGFGFCLSTTYMPGAFFTNYLWNNDANILTVDGNVALNSTNAIEAFDFIKSMYPYMPPGVTEWGWTEIKEAIPTGLCAMVQTRGMSTYEQVVQMNPEMARNVSCFITPLGPSGETPVCGVTLSGIFVTSATRHYDVVKDFLQFMYQPENWIKIIEGKPLYLIPPGSLIWGSPGYQNLPKVQEGLEYLEKYIEMTMYSRSELMDNPGYPSGNPSKIVSGMIITDILQEILLLDVTPEQAVEDHVDEMLDLLG